MKRTVLILLACIAGFATPTRAQSSAVVRESAKKTDTTMFAKFFGDVISAKRKNVRGSLKCDERLAEYVMHANGPQIVEAFWTLEIFIGTQKMTSKNAMAIEYTKKILLSKKDALGLTNEEVAFNEEEVNAAIKKFVSKKDINGDD